MNLREMAMGKSFNEFTTLKQGIVVGLFLAATIFGSDIRGVVSSSTGNLLERVTKVETENEEHSAFSEQMAKNAALLSEVQKIQATVVTQVANISTVVDAMVAREYARLSKHSAGTQ